MAPKKSSVVTSARVVALVASARAELAQSVETLGTIREATAALMDGLEPEPEALRLAAIGVQAEALRHGMAALSMRAAGERLFVASQLATDRARKDGGQ
jgi:hypothetical protein